MLLGLTMLLKQVWLLLTGSLGWTSLIPPGSLIGLRARTLIARISLLAQTLLPKIGLLEQIKLVSMSLLEQISLPIIGLLGWKIIVLNVYSK